MAYDMEKYRDKREKVLGIKKRGLSFGVIASIVSICMVIGLSIVVVPKAVSFLITRNFDDAIYKREDAHSWPKEILSQIAGIEGVENVVTDKKETRLIVTFDRTVLDTGRFAAIFKEKGLKSTLLNRVGHRQRVTTLEEEKEFEAL